MWEGFLLEQVIIVTYPVFVGAIIYLALRLKQEKRRNNKLFEKLYVSRNRGK